MAKNSLVLLFFFFNYTATTEIYTLSLHDALPIRWRRPRAWPSMPWRPRPGRQPPARDRKSTRLNSSHEWTSNAVFCLKKKKRFAIGTPTRHSPQQVEGPSPPLPGSYQAVRLSDAQIIQLALSFFFF